MFTHPQNITITPQEMADERLKNKLKNTKNKSCRRAIHAFDVYQFAIKKDNKNRSGKLPSRKFFSKSGELWKKESESIKNHCKMIAQKAQAILERSFKDSYRELNSSHQTENINYGLTSLGQIDSLNYTCVNTDEHQSNVSVYLNDNLALSQLQPDVTVSLYRPERNLASNQLHSNASGSLYQPECNLTFNQLQSNVSDFIYQPESNSTFNQLQSDVSAFLYQSECNLIFNQLQPNASASLYQPECNSTFSHLQSNASASLYQPEFNLTFNQLQPNASAFLYQTECNLTFNQLQSNASASLRANRNFFHLYARNVCVITNL
ncbi:6408_t:CDS:1 [Ambispora leptoticha]|uniref:6408_t:CDS:1 n=1 Tax=Ambispora leptoticha TaxID=144679 RepID=A0A9N9B3G0_9GLOM|nr:6408_t:CDS:1 [Ambispora leptoticha]